MKIFRILFFLSFLSTTYTFGQTTPTVLNRGDFAILGVNGNLPAPNSSRDEISFVCFKDITTGTEIQVTDNGYENCVAGRWSGGEGGAILRRTGGTIPAGTVITFRTTQPTYTFVSPDVNGWTVSNLSTNQLASALNISTDGDQIYFAQGGTWSEQSTNCAIQTGNSGPFDRINPNAIFPGNNGRILFGFSTNGWDGFQRSSSQSGLYPGMECFSMAPTGGTEYNKYIGPTSDTTQTAWLKRINNKSYWRSFTGSNSTAATNAYNAQLPNLIGLKLNIIPGGDIPTATWTAPTSAICQASTPINLNSLITGTTGGTWSGTSGVTGNTFNPAGLNGNIDITYSVPYTTCTISVTQTITVTAATATVSYAGSPFCNSGSVSPSITGITGGTFTAPSGLSINVNTGQINLATSTAGTYTITYTYNNGTCSGFANTNITINAVTAPTLVVANNCGSSTLTASNFTGTLNWSDNGTGNPRTVTNAASYSVTQTVGSCTSAASNAVTSAPIATPNAPTLVVANNCGSSTLTASNFTGTLNWSDNGTGNPRTVTNAATFTVTQTVNGCTSAASSAVTTAPIAIPTAPTLAVANNCGSSVLTASNFTGTLNWSDNVVTTSPRSVTNAATFTVTQTVNGCTSVASNAVTSAPNSIVTPTISVTASQTTICNGTNVTFNAAITNGGSTPIYRWLLNGNVVGTNSATFSSATLLNNDRIICELTSNATCAQPTTVQSNTITITVTSNLNPSVSISASQTTICAGTAVTFTATAANAGTNPTYQWRVNNVNVGTNSATFTSSSFINNDLVTCVVIGNSTCALTTNANSNIIAMQVNPLPSVAAITGNNTVCINGNTTLTNTTANGVWSSQNTNIATVNNTGIVTGIAAGNATIQYTLTNSCGTDSKTFTISVNTVPTAALLSGPSTINIGINTPFTANITGGLWASITPAIASITSGGTAIGIANGIANFTYTLTNACGNTVSNISTTVVGAPDDLFFPNFFTPNGDGKNDVYRVFGSQINRLELKIFNQWGAVVFETKDAARGWDGSFNGKQQPVGVYVYTATIVLQNGRTIQSKGSISLIR